MKIPILRRRDVLIFLLALMIAFVALLPRLTQRAGDLVTVSHDGEQIDTLRLSELQEPKEITYSLPTGSVTLSVSAEGVAVIASDCPTESCVRTGSISRAGESIVCVPMHFSVLIEGDGQYDGVTE